MTILNACAKNVWKLIEGTAYIYIYIYIEREREREEHERNNIYVTEHYSQPVSTLGYNLGKFIQLLFILPDKKVYECQGIGDT